MKPNKQYQKHSFSRLYLLGLTVIFITSLIFFYNRSEFNLSFQAGEKYSLLNKVLNERLGHKI